MKGPSNVTVWALALVFSTCGEIAAGLDLDITSDESIKSVASTLAYDMMTYYKGNVSGGIPGNLPGPPPDPSITNAGYFWWECGAMFGSLIDYWYYTGDSTYNSEVMQGLQFQVGAKNDYLPQNQTNGMGNDDQAFWAMSAMTAAELGFPKPNANQPSWLGLVQAVFNIQYAKIDNEYCGGGLRWQAYKWLRGYDYKNSIANGCFFNIAARLAAYTGNITYAQAAETSWDWSRSVKLIDDSYNVFDGAKIDQNCSQVNKQQFSYNAGVYILGAATMYNITNGTQKAVWADRLDKLLTQTISVFFPDGIAYEVACEKALIHCTIDMLSYKAYLTRWMAAATKVAPNIYDRVIAVLKTSAQAAAKTCVGSPAGHPNGRMCGLQWSSGKWDGTSGVGQQMAALETIQSLLIAKAKAPLSSKTGGNSESNPGAGTTNPGASNPVEKGPATTGDKAGAAILTTVFIGVVVAGLVWLSMPDGKIV